MDSEEINKVQIFYPKVLEDKQSYFLSVGDLKFEYLKCAHHLNCSSIKLPGTDSLWLKAFP